MGQGILNGINVTDKGKAFITNGTGGATYTTGSGEFASGGIGSSAARTAAFTFQGIGYYGADGKIRDTGIVIFNGKGNGNLAFAGNAYGVYKG
jgi:hypothetical protein